MLNVTQTPDGFEVVIENVGTVGLVIQLADAGAVGPTVMLRKDDVEISVQVPSASARLLAEHLLSAVALEGPSSDAAVLRKIGDRYLGRWHQLDFSDADTRMQLALDVGRLVGMSQRLHTVATAMRGHVDAD